MFYTVYKITNLVNGKTYIGKHQTENLDDGYMGSGKLLKRAIEKYGLENFKKEILFVFESEDEMNAKEAELVNEEYLSSDMTYNLCPGGQGGFGYINKNDLNVGKHVTNIGLISKNLRATNTEYSEFFSNNSRMIMLKNHSEGKVKPLNWTGRKHKPETLEKMKGKGHQKGKGNSQYGTCWITNGIENKKIKKEELDNWIGLGYKQGRVF